MNVDILFLLFLFGKRVGQLASPSHRERMITGTILWLTKQQERSVTQLAELLTITPSTMSEKLTQLEHDGLIKRKTSLRDHRAQVVIVTKQGTAQLDVMVSMMNHGCMTHLQALSPKEIKQFESMLQKLMKESI